MTTNTKDIEALVDEHCSSIHPMELDRLLRKLDHEDLHVLKDMLEESYDAGNIDSNYIVEMMVKEHYDKGYEDGWSDGFSSLE